jgi:hypothetical protein
LQITTRGDNGKKKELIHRGKRRERNEYPSRRSPIFLSTVVMPFWSFSSSFKDPRANSKGQ